MNSAIQVRGLKKRYDSNIVLNGLDFEIEKGETFALLGVNGAGKTTALECIEGLILSRLVDTFISRISLTMLPVPKPHNTACVLSWEEARRWQSRSSGYSSS